MGGAVESVQHLFKGRAVRGLTEIGLGWLIVSLVLALAAEAALALAWALIDAGWLAGFGSAAPFTTVWETLLAVCIIPAFLGFRTLRRGDPAPGSEPQAAVRAGTVAFILAAVSASLLVVTGLVLGFVYVPNGANAGDSNISPLWLLAGLGIRAIHHVTPSLIAAFVGLFILGFVWQLSSRWSRVLAVVALVSGVSVPTMLLIGLEVPAMPFPAGGEFTLELLATLSLGLWLAVCHQALARLRGVRPRSSPNATRA